MHNRKLMAAALISSFALLPCVAKATLTFPAVVTTFQVAEGCVLVQFYGGAPKEWYSVPNSDSLVNAQKAQSLRDALAGVPIQHADLYGSCGGYESIVNIMIGQAPR
jgi:hypothetical protein